MILYSMLIVSKQLKGIKKMKKQVQKRIVLAMKKFGYRFPVRSGLATRIIWELGFCERKLNSLASNTLAYRK